MACFGIVWALLCLGPEASGSELHQEKLAVCPTAGVAFREPKGWLEQLKDKGKTVARWISPDSKPGKPTAMIMIECWQTPAASLDEVARGPEGGKARRAEENHVRTVGPRETRRRPRRLAQLHDTGRRAR